MEEMNSLCLNDTQTLVHKTMGSRLINSKWSFKLKDGITGTNKKIFKVKLVVKGFT